MPKNAQTFTTILFIPKAGKAIRRTHPSRGWIYGPETMAKLIEQGRILWPKSASGRPRLKRYITDMKNPTTGFSTILSAPANVDGTKTLGKILGPKTFAFPKPHGLIKILINQVTEKNSIVMDSFAGSGTTGQAVLDLNKEDGGNRRFILVEMEAEICQQVTVERLKRVINGYANSDGLTDKLSEGLGGSFRYCNLGIPLFDENGSITKEVGFQSLAAHVYFSETGEPLNDHFSPKSPLLGIHNGTAIYLLYNGILEDKRPQGGNVLTRAAFDILPVHDGAKVIYGTSCRLGEERLKKENITFKQIPYEVRVF